MSAAMCVHCSTAAASRRRSPRRIDTDIAQLRESLSQLDLIVRRHEQSLVTTFPHSASMQVQIDALNADLGSNRRRKTG